MHKQMHELAWRKSSKSSPEGNSLEAVQDPDDPNGVLLRESDDPAAVLKTTKVKLWAWKQGLLDGEFDDLMELPEGVPAGGGSY